MLKPPPTNLLLDVLGVIGSRTGKKFFSLDNSFSFSLTFCSLLFWKRKSRYVKTQFRIVKRLGLGIQTKLYFNMAEVKPVVHVGHV